MTGFYMECNAGLKLVNKNVNIIELFLNAI